MRRAFALIAVVTASSQAAADPAPQAMLGTWAKDGKCSLPSERMAVTPTTVTMGEGKPSAIVFYRHEVSGFPTFRWTAQGEVAHVQYFEPSDTLAFYGLGWGMGGPTAGYRRCGP
ncbi:hypothetical protein [Reyranella sp.]|uniref:hypothetical protein n=1 Tax=Reyranella sp. TaxID=1929291 RepID=UPI003C7D5498